MDTATDRTQERAAYLGGRLAARSSRPLTDCPFDAESQQLLATWFVRGYRSIEMGGGSDVSAPALSG